jgi:hypothetical protein
VLRLAGALANRRPNPSDAAPCVAGVEVPLEGPIGAQQPATTLGGPVEIVHTPAVIPGLGWRVGHVTHVADLVGKLDQLVTRRQVRRVLDLQPFAFQLRERFVVGHLLDELADSIPELTFAASLPSLRFLRGVIVHFRK